MQLAEALAPVPLEEFLQSHLGLRHIVICGKPGRFHRLVSWDELNQTLSRLRVNEGRVSLVRHAKAIARESYVQTSQSGKVQYLIGHAVARHVADGATLVVNQVDELFPEVRQLAESCENIFRTYVAANLYAGWRTDNGFDVHWDSHDTLILQVRGRKDWKLWSPTREHPLPGDGRNVAPVPSGEPVWQGTLDDGDALYMPRGWWHVAYPRDEPSVHVTLGLNHLTGIDLLGWVARRLRECVTVRTDIPHWKSTAERLAWIGAVRESCVQALADDVVEQFMSDQEERAHSRPIVRLPESVGASRVVVSADTPLWLTRGRRLHFESTNDAAVLTFKAGGVLWRCPRSLAGALGLLTHYEACTLAEMSAVVDEPARPLLRQFIDTLVVADVVWASPSTAYPGMEDAEPVNVEHDANGLSRSALRGSGLPCREG